MLTLVALNVVCSKNYIISELTDELIHELVQHISPYFQYIIALYLLSYVLLLLVLSHSLNFWYHFNFKNSFFHHHNLFVETLWNVHTIQFYINPNIKSKCLVWYCECCSIESLKTQH